MKREVVNYDQSPFNKQWLVTFACGHEEWKKRRPGKCGNCSHCEYDKKARKGEKQ
jgi:hypothetical protein